MPNLDKTDPVKWLFQLLDGPHVRVTDTSYRSRNTYTLCSEAIRASEESAGFVSLSQVKNYFKSENSASWPLFSEDGKLSLLSALFQPKSIFFSDKYIKNQQYKVEIRKIVTYICGELIKLSPADLSAMLMHGDAGQTPFYNIVCFCKVVTEDLNISKLIKAIEPKEQVAVLCAGNRRLDQTVLHTVAARRFDESVISALGLSGLDEQAIQVPLNHRDKNGDLAIHMLFSLSAEFAGEMLPGLKGMLSLIPKNQWQAQFLLEKNHEGNSAFALAVACGLANCVQHLLAVFRDNQAVLRDAILVENLKGQNAIRLACAAGKPDIAIDLLKVLDVSTRRRLLLETDITKDAVPLARATAQKAKKPPAFVVGQTELMIAASTGDMQIVRQQLASLEEFNETSQAEIHTALLKQNAKGQSAIHLACIAGNKDVLEILLNLMALGMKKQALQEKDANKNTPLHYIKTVPAKAMFELIIGIFAPTNCGKLFLAKNKLGICPLDHMAKPQHQATFDLLCQHIESKALHDWYQHSELKPSILSIGADQNDSLRKTVTTHTAMFALVDYLVERRHERVSGESGYTKRFNHILIFLGKALTGDVLPTMPSEIKASRIGYGIFSHTSTSRCESALLAVANALNQLGGMQLRDKRVQEFIDFIKPHLPQTPAPSAPGMAQKRASLSGRERAWGFVSTVGTKLRQAPAAMLAVPGAVKDKVKGAVVPDHRDEVLRDLAIGLETVLSPKAKEAAAATAQGTTDGAATALPPPAYEDDTSAPTTEPAPPAPPAY